MSSQPPERAVASMVSASASSVGRAAPREAPQSCAAPASCCACRVPPYRRDSRIRACPTPSPRCDCATCPGRCARPPGCSRRHRTARCRRCRSICCRPDAAPSAPRGAASASPSASPSRPAPRSAAFSSSVKSRTAIFSSQSAGSSRDRAANKSSRALEMRGEHPVEAVVVPLVLDQAGARQIVEPFGAQPRRDRPSSASSRVSNSVMDTGTPALLSRKKNLTSIPAIEKQQLFEQMHVLLVLEQRAVQRRDELLGVVAAQRLPAEYPRPPAA